MNHPLLNMPHDKQTRLIGLFLSATVIGAIIQGALIPVDKILAYELAGSPMEATSILYTWGVATQKAALLSLYWDYFFLGAYASFLWVLLAKAAQHQSSPFWRKAGFALSWSQIITALMDSVENIGLIIGLNQHPNIPYDSLWPFIACICAKIKFALLGLAVLYLMLAWAPLRASEDQQQV